jgi:hypothetical protein
MTTVWMIGSILILGSSLLLAWATLQLVRQQRLARETIQTLGRRVDELSLRVRTLENRPIKTTPIVRRMSNKRVDFPASPPPAPFAGPTLITVPSLASNGSEAVAQGASGELSRRYSAIWNLADSGESVASIAQSTGHPLGEVELILGLRRSAVNSGSESHSHE